MSSAASAAAAATSGGSGAAASRRKAAAAATSTTTTTTPAPTPKWETTESLSKDEREMWADAEREYNALLERSRTSSATPKVANMLKQQQPSPPPPDPVAATQNTPDDGDSDEVPINEALLSSWVPTRMVADAALAQFSAEAAALASTAAAASGAGTQQAAGGGGGALIITGDPDAPPEEQLAMMRAAYPLANLPPTAVECLSYECIVRSGFAFDALCPVDAALAPLVQWLRSALESEEPFRSLDEFVAETLPFVRKVASRRHESPPPVGAVTRSFNQCTAASAEAIVVCFYCHGEVFVHCALDTWGPSLLRGFMLTRYTGGGGATAAHRHHQTSVST